MSIIKKNAVNLKLFCSCNFNYVIILILQNIIYKLIGQSYLNNKKRVLLIDNFYVILYLLMRKKQVKIKKKSYVAHYLRLYFICQIVLIISFVSAFVLIPKERVCANSESCKQNLTEKIENNSLGIFEGRTVVPPKIDLASEINSKSVLGVRTPDENKHIYVDLEAQKLYAYEGVNEFMQTYIASGRWGKTPVGNFNIWSKFRATRMSGGSGADYYDLPNVPYTMYFYGDFGLHGAYWHNNFGHTMSHGCVNMRIVDAKKLFEWADGPSGGQKGTAVSVCQRFEAPNNCVQNEN